MFDLGLRTIELEGEMQHWKNEHHTLSKEVKAAKSGLELYSDTTRELEEDDHLLRAHNRYLMADAKVKPTPRKKHSLGY